MSESRPLEYIKGVGPATAQKFAAAGLATVDDLLYFLPRRYEDFSRLVPLARLKPGKVTVKATVESAAGRYIRRKLHVTEAVIADASGKARAVWFNQPYRAEQLAKGETFYFAGEYAFARNRYVLNNPSVEREADFAISTGRIVPIYPEIRGIRSLSVRRVLREIMPVIEAWPETLPPELLRRHKLMPLGPALKQLHFPDSTELLDRARARLAFEELLPMLLASLLTRHQNAKLESYAIPFKADVARAFTQSLPFALTNAQRRAAWEIIQDLGRPVPMNRLLQGDVGSGKTMVAAMAAYMAIRAGYQVALMAPTEILAAQHAQTIAAVLEPLGARMALLVGSVKGKPRELLKAAIARGEADFVVGTHALIQKDVVFAKLGMVVIDEQHRFGVEQRAVLLAKSAKMPHLLSMTATPIPRSLQLTVYGELEVSVIDELPAGRQPIVTELCSPYGRAAVNTHIEAQLAEGRQAYVVCPAIADNPESEFKSVEAEYKRLKESAAFKHRRLGLLHGKLKPDEKEQIMRRFKAGDIDILVATSVIEVGVDVPNATVMLIEGAERFGLAQLHQLRGRVGRGAHQSYCYLMPSSGKKPSERLAELERSQDGFYLAEADLRLRGPGEIYGRMQHGALNLQVANLADTRLIKRVRDSAQWLLDSGQDLLQYKQLSRQVARYRGLTSLN